MSLSDLASLGSFVSGFAVLVSLIFLYFQLRQVTEQIKQAEKNQQAAIRQGRAAILIDTNLRIAEGMADVFLPIASGRAVPADLTQLRQFFALALAGIQLWEEEFDQHLEGLLSDRVFESIARSVKNQMRNPGHRVFWKMVRERFGEQFVGFVDKIVAETPVVQPSDYSLEQWKAEVATELAKVPPAN
jgi:hypothetical protein